VICFKLRSGADAFTPTECANDFAAAGTLRHLASLSSRSCLLCRQAEKNGPA
jgi:hypothetical protein